MTLKFSVQRLVENDKETEQMEQDEKELMKKVSFLNLLSFYQVIEFSRILKKLKNF